MAFRFCSGTDPGCTRPNNQDSLLADPELGLFVIADGMGGHADGGLASRIVIDSVRRFFVETSVDDNKTWPFGYDLALSYPANRLRAAVLAANGALAHHIAEHGESRGMGATLVAAVVGERAIVVANVGDCRAYLFQDAMIRRLTRDHSWVQEQLDGGLLSPEAARTHPWRHMVTRAVQGDYNLTVDTYEFTAVGQARLLLCSDGLHGVVLDDELQMMLTDGAGTAPGEICAALLRAALARGAPDNVSVIVLDC